jgi:tRNA pseudouridine55 synthase
MPRSSGLDGILLIDKPSGWTSHDVVARTRRITGQRRIGHTGTLDPMATGLLVLCLGNATRLVEYMSAHDKTYEGEVRLGVSTDTDDADGTVTGTAAIPPLTDATIAGLMETFTGTIAQLPPAYSAVKVAGRRAYAVARAGEAPALRARKVTLHALTLRQLAPDRLAITVACGPGTYIRSLARDIGSWLSCGAHLASLRRTSVGSFHVDAAATLEMLEAAAQARDLGRCVIASDEGILGHPAAILGAEHAVAFANGIAIQHMDSPAMRRDALRVYSTSGAFSGVARLDEYGELRPLKVFKSTA